MKGPRLCSHTLSDSAPGPWAVQSGVLPLLQLCLCITGLSVESTGSWVLLHVKCGTQGIRSVSYCAWSGYPWDESTSPVVSSIRNCFKPKTSTSRTLVPFFLGAGRKGSRLWIIGLVVSQGTGLLLPC